MKKRSSDLGLAPREHARAGKFATRETLFAIKRAQDFLTQGYCKRARRASVDAYVALSMALTHYSSAGMAAEFQPKFRKAEVFHKLDLLEKLFESTCINISASERQLDKYESRPRKPPGKQ